jgi:hypothetical protein
MRMATTRWQFFQDWLGFGGISDIHLKTQHGQPLKGCPNIILLLMVKGDTFRVQRVIGKDGLIDLFQWYCRTAARTPIVIDELVRRCASQPGQPRFFRHCRQILLLERRNKDIKQKVFSILA